MKESLEIDLGIIASSTEERVAAKVVLSQLTIGDLRNNP